MNKIQAGVSAMMMAAALLTGCATSTGTAGVADQSKLATIKTGKTTMKDVKALLGQPASVDLTESGEQVWMYQRTDVSAKAYIPFLNMTSGAITSKSLTIRFSKSGVVKAMAGGEI